MKAVSLNLERKVARGFNQKTRGGSYRDALRTDQQAVYRRPWRLMVWPEIFSSKARIRSSRVRILAVIA